MSGHTVGAHLVEVCGSEGGTDGLCCAIGLETMRERMKIDETGDVRSAYQCLPTQISNEPAANNLKILCIQKYTFEVVKFKNPRYIFKLLFIISSVLSLDLHKTSSSHGCRNGTAGGNTPFRNE